MPQKSYINVCFERNPAQTSKTCLHIITNRTIKNANKNPTRINLNKANTGPEQLLQKQKKK